MAITHMDYIGPPKNRAKHAHLENAINYILNPKKTDDGLYTGGNVSDDPKEILEAMLNTKGIYDKYDGRQGYHFIISFAPGEATEKECFDLAEKFCKEYLRDDFEYVFAVHNDKHHIHAHIIFNSVKRSDGYKYYYKNGDWAKYIQPITDKLCEEMNLPVLKYDKKEGKSYAEWKNEKKGNYTWKSIIQSDIDYAISKASSFEEFKKILKDFCYDLREGHSEKRNEDYIAFIAPGQKRAWRSYNLGVNYSVDEIKERIKNEKEFKPTVPEFHKKIKKDYKPYLKDDSHYSKFQRSYVNKITRAENRFINACPVLEHERKVRSDLLNIEKIYKTCKYIITNNIKTEEELFIRAERLKQIEKRYKNNKYKSIDYSKNEQVINYNKLVKEFINETDDVKKEEILEQIEEAEKELPIGINEITNTNNEKILKSIRAEKRIINQIKKELKEEHITNYQRHKLNVMFNDDVNKKDKDIKQI